MLVFEQCPVKRKISDFRPPDAQQDRQHPTEVECRLSCCPILLSRCRFCSFLKLLSYQHTAERLPFFAPPAQRGFLSQRGSAASLFPTPCGDESKGPFSFAKENGPFGTPRERLRLAVQSLNDLCPSGMRLPARGVAALGVAKRFASAPIIRCRSAHLVEVQPNFRLPEHSTMRRAQQCRYFARSLPPSKRHTRLTTVRRGCKT